MSQPSQPSAKAPADDDMICYCMVVEAGRLRAAIARGAHDVESLQYATGACAGCGSCREDLEALLREAGHRPGEKR